MNHNPLFFKLRTVEVNIKTVNVKW